MTKQPKTKPRTPWLITSRMNIGLRRFCPGRKYHIPGTGSRNTDEHTESQIPKVKWGHSSSAKDTNRSHCEQLVIAEFNK